MSWLRGRARGSNTIGARRAAVDAAGARLAPATLGLPPMAAALRISVLLPARDAGPFVEAALDSVARQRGGNEP